VIGEAVERYWEGGIRGTLHDVSNFENVLACARREPRELIVGSNVVDERIVQSFAEFVGDRQNIGKDRGVTEYGICDVGSSQAANVNVCTKILLFVWFVSKAVWKPPMQQSTGACATKSP